MEYPVLLTTEGNKTLATVPDCPGCQTFAEPGEDILELAQEALEGWLEVGLEDGEAPPRPSEKVRIPAGAKLKHVRINPKLAVALYVRWARQEAGMSQAALARKLGVSQQQAAKLEQPNANPTLDTLAKIAAALNVDFFVELARRRRRLRLSDGRKPRRPRRPRTTPR
ncbi:MAG: type II toxin-antitoxin system HicB family antitoxin [Gemmatimonadota bacterium]|nr:type II toxin-antitoxin system HicB family antitoxin [Gemmatimonadota bacterium]